MDVSSLGIPDVGDSELQGEGSVYALLVWLIQCDRVVLMEHERSLSILSSELLPSLVMPYCN